MYDNREFFLEKQINLYEVLINSLENSKMNQKEKRDLVNIKDLYKKYTSEYEALLITNH
jgi:hypothetical protein